MNEKIIISIFYSLLDLLQFNIYNPKIKLKKGVKLTFLTLHISINETLFSIEPSTMVVEW